MLPCQFDDPLPVLGALCRDLLERHRATVARTFDVEIKALHYHSPVADSEAFLSGSEFF